MIINTYIVRFYQREKDDPQRLVGIVEEVGVKGRRAFTNYDELWEILSSPTFLSSSRPGTRKSRKTVFKKTGIKKGGDNIL